MVIVNGVHSPAGTGAVNAHAFGNPPFTNPTPGKFADTVINALAVHNEYRYICGPHHPHGPHKRFFKLGGNYAHGTNAGVKAGDKCKTTHARRTSFSNAEHLFAT